QDFPRRRPVPAAKKTTDHEKIRRWAEARDGRPTTVKGTTSDTAGVLRIDFPGYSGEQTLHPISWPEFFEKFDEKELAFLYQEKTPGGRRSRFCKLVRRDNGRGRRKQ